MRIGLKCLVVVLLLSGLALSQMGQQEYKPKFPGDPARSDTEASALGYMRVVVNAQKLYSKKHSGKYATSLSALVGQGSFTKRMTNTDRGEYKVRFRGNGEDYSLWLTPTTVTPTTRAFYVNNKGSIRVEEDKEAGPESPILKADS